MTARGGHRPSRRSPARPRGRSGGAPAGAVPRRGPDPGRGGASRWSAGVGLVSNDASDTVSATSTDLAAGQLPLVTTVTDRQGAPLAYLYDQNRQPTPLESIAPTMKAAIVAIEDRRFYEHEGVDWTGTLRALVTNQSAGSTQQGASTLTQQYIKNYQLYVTAQTQSERLKATEATYARKLREVRVALQLERQLADGRTKHEAKDEVLAALPQHRLPGEQLLRRRRRGPHLLQHHAGPADDPAGRAARRHGPVAPRRSTRSRTRRPRPAAATRSSTRWRSRGSSPRPRRRRRRRARSASSARWPRRPTAASGRATRRSSASTSSTTSGRRGSRPSSSTARATRSAPRWTAPR